MDISLPDLAGLDEIAARLERCAERVDAAAVRARAGTSETWQGRAADRHRERVADHVADLRELASGLRGAAARVRVLASTARERVDLLSAVDLTAGLVP